MKSNGEFEVGDIVQVINLGYNNTKHHWFKNEKILMREHFGNTYTITDVDYSDLGKYGNGYTIQINDTAYGTNAVKLIQAIPTPEELVNSLDGKISAMERRLHGL